MTALHTLGLASIALLVFGVGALAWSWDWFRRHENDEVTV